VSRGGYDDLLGSLNPTHPLRFVIEPTHDAEPFHHFGPGCTTVHYVTESDIIELRTEDQSCKLEIDAWELIWYLDEDVDN
jgi:hypothetical protein